MARRTASAPPTISETVPRHRSMPQAGLPCAPLHRPGEVVGAGEQSRHATDGGYRRVVGMERQADAGGLRDGQHGIQEAAVVASHLLARRLLGGRRLGVHHRVARGHQVGVEGAHQRPATTWRIQRRAPHEGGHEVVAQQPDTRPAHVADGAAVVLQLVLPAGLAQHHLVVEGDRDVLEGLQRQALCLDACRAGVAGPPRASSRRRPGSRAC